MAIFFSIHAIPKDYLKRHRGLVRADVTIPSLVQSRIPRVDALLKSAECISITCHNIHGVMNAYWFSSPLTYTTTGDRLQGQHGKGFDPVLHFLS